MGTLEASSPGRILRDTGRAFCIGAIGGGAFHFIKAAYNSPKRERLVGGFQAMRMNAPRIGGSFAIWGGLFSTFNFTMVRIRHKEDQWNPIVAAAATGGLLQLRQGFGAASQSAVLCGGIMALLSRSPDVSQNLEVSVSKIGGVPGYSIGKLSGPGPESSSSSSSPQRDL